MTDERKRYGEDHWIRSHDPEKALAAYLDQQSKAYSQAKNALLRELLGDLNGKRFLDYGCGGGAFTVYAALQGAARVVGVDAEETVLATARYYARREGVEHLCHFISSEKFPSFPVHSRFDVILLKDVIEHVQDDQALLDNVAEAIAPGGVLVISTQNSFSLNYLVQGTYHRLIQGEENWYGWDPTHVRFYSPVSLKRKLKKAGFRSVAWRSAYIIPYKLPGLPGTGREFLRIDSLSWIDRTLGRVSPYNRLGWNIMVKAEASRVVFDAVSNESRRREDLPPLALPATRSIIPSRTANL
jgi:2-polyprenyl-6-hydroxyphenyl methylase/3-demethylubiquinone-9 3-methyltransferase